MPLPSKPASRCGTRTEVEVLWDYDEQGGASMDREDGAQAARRMSQAALTEGYRQMADDTEHEMEAEEWAEAMIGDAF